MAQYIDKDALVAELARQKAQWRICKSSEAKYRQEMLDDISSFIDTLEVKVMDLEDSTKETLAQKYINYTFKRHSISPESKEGQLIYYAYMHGMNQCLNQLKAQKGEEV